ncbi:MAG: hypothetical protein J7551_00485 [Chloroflexi bacterium]|nr:hypothetical protein [Chloroflexota bacterium]
MPAPEASESASPPEQPPWMKAILPPYAGPGAESATAEPAASVPPSRSKEALDESRNESSDEAPGEASEALSEDFEETERLLTLDPLFIYGIALVVTVFGLGSMPLETRLTIVWTALSALGFLAILVDEIEIVRPSVRDIAIGAGYATLVGAPIFVIGSAQLKRIAGELFSGMSATSVFLLLIFAMPAAETLFFRGAFLAARGLMLSALAGGVWSCLLLLAGLNVIAYPFVALVISLALVALNFLYSYLAAVYNLFSAWTCQIIMNALLLWLPSLL